MVIACVNRAEQGALAPGAPPQQPVSFSVHLPQTLSASRLGGSISGGGGGGGGAPAAPAAGRPHFFSVDAAQGTVAPGAKHVVAFRFAPPEAPAAGAAAALGALSVGEWHEVDATVTLKGGYVVPGAPDERSVTVRLRGYVPGAGKK